MNGYVNKINKEMFEDIVAFSMSEVGAMGPNDMTFYKKNGESFNVDYKNEETSYEKLKECFPSLVGCYWNGPMRGEKIHPSTVVIGGGGRETTVPDGYRHMYLDYGNHLAVKEELYDSVKDILKDKNNCEITFEWCDFLDEVDFAHRIDELSND